MEFYTQSYLKRPIRLSEKTRHFAYDSLNHKYGKDTVKNPAVSLDNVENYSCMTQLEQYDAAILEIVQKAPIRICQDELVCGAATFGAAIDGRLPATFNGKYVFNSIDHLTIDFETVIKYGVKYIQENAEKSLEQYNNTEKEPFIKSCLHCINCMMIWRQRYLNELINLPKYKDNYNNLSKVPYEPASNFYEAVQSLWFTFSFVRLFGNWPGIGRIDLILGQYLENDLKKGIITVDEAREILAHFFIKGCEWIKGGDYGSGDAQHYQNILLAGIDKTGQEITNTVTYLVLEIIEELGISDFPITVRLNKNSPKKLLHRVAEVIRYGGGIIAIYNEDLIIEALIKDGYELHEARTFANDGCWEVQIPGKTYFLYYPLDALFTLQQRTLKKYEQCPDYPDFESLYRQYISDLHKSIENILHIKQELFESTNRQLSNWRWKTQIPCTVVSVFEQGCIEKGLSYLEGGPVYNIYSPHLGGFADIVNSLYAIKKLVFDEKKLSLQEFMNVLNNNWEKNEPLRQYVLNRYIYYGNDNDEVDDIAIRLLDDFADICSDMNDKCGYRFPAGISTFGRQLTWLPYRIACPHGRKKGEILAGNCSPTPGSDKEGVTAVIRSYCKCHLDRLASGAALDLKLLPSNLIGEEGIQALTSLIEGFIELGGFFMQLDIADASILKEAQKHPENYETLSVRVSGWNARFVTLSKEWQDMIIEQIEK